MQRAVAFLVLALLVVTLPTQAAPDDQPVTILTARSRWHIFSTLKPPLLKLDEGPKPITSTFEWLDKESPNPPANWTAPDFRDNTWLRGRATSGPQTPYLANLALRARFEVTNPGAVKDLKLTVSYYGGLAVFLNGKEIARDHLPKSGRPDDALADAYPEAAYVTDQGEIIPSGWMTSKYPDALAARERKLEVPIPASALQKGANLLALQVIRAPYHKDVGDYWKRNAAKDRRELKDVDCPYDLSWNTCELRDVSLVAAGGAGGGGILTNAGRPKELQAWNSDLLTTDLATDTGDRAFPLQPITITGSKNGWASGKIVVGSPAPIESLKASVSDLKQGAATIPASQVRARYAVAFNQFNRDDSALEALLESPLETFPLLNKACVVPIWLTVKIPADAKPGAYTGTVTISAQNEKPITVPIALSVADFSIPDSQDFTTWIELMQSPDTLAAEYNVPLWSDKHLQLCGQSLRYIGEISSRVAYVPLIAETNSGNAESMVRYIKKSDGTYDFDFSIMDKYLDLTRKNMGKPKFTVFTVWEIYLNTPKEEIKLTDKESEYTAMEKSWEAARWNLRGKGPAITVLDPATNKTSLAYLPRFEDPAAKPIWKALFDQLHKRMADRGLEDTMLMGMASDYWPSAQEMVPIDEACGHLKWINHTHHGPMGAKMGGVADVAYTAYVWPVEYAQDPSKGRIYGWQRKELNTEFRRFSSLNEWPLTSLLLFSEIQITGKQRGLGRIGADFWPVAKDKRGQRRGWVWDKYPQSKWHSCNLMSYMLAAGPDGPVATARYEALREGLQQCEARIAIERILTDPAKKSQLSPELASRAEQLLDDRVSTDLKAFNLLQLTNRTYATSKKHAWDYGCGGEAGALWYQSSGWQNKAGDLYTTAGEITKPARR